MSVPVARSIRLVGVTFADGYPESLHRLREAVAEAALRGEPLTAILRRDPQNAHDPNCIEVHVPAIGGRVGSIPRSEAVTLAPRIDAGETWSASVLYVAVNDEHPELPGIQVVVEQVNVEVPAR